MNRKESIIQDIRDLRDDDSHVCPADKDDYLECTCTKYDHVIDKLEDFITELKDKIINLSISVACMIDDIDEVKQKDVEHIQDLTTQLENIVDSNTEKRWD